jgi:hypothetical protein
MLIALEDHFEIRISSTRCSGRNFSIYAFIEVVQGAATLKHLTANPLPHYLWLSTLPKSMKRSLKLLVAQLIQKHRLLCNLQVHCGLYKETPLVLMLSKINILVVHTHPSYLIFLSNILSPSLDLPKDLIRSRSSTNFECLSHVAHWPCLTRLILDFIILIIFGEELQLRNISIQCIFIQPAHKIPTYINWNKIFQCTCTRLRYNETSLYIWTCVIQWVNYFQFHTTCQTVKRGIFVS